MTPQLIEKMNFPASIGRVNRLYFWPELDAQKSVKYVPAPDINHADAIRTRGDARLFPYFFIYFSGLQPLTSRQGAFS